MLVKINIDHAINRCILFIDSFQKENKLSATKMKLTASAITTILIISILSPAIAKKEKKRKKKKDHQGQNNAENIIYSFNGADGEQAPESELYSPVIISETDVLPIEHLDSGYSADSFYSEEVLPMQHKSKSKKYTRKRSKSKKSHKKSKSKKSHKKSKKKKSKKKSKGKKSRSKRSGSKKSDAEEDCDFDTTDPVDDPSEPIKEKLPVNDKPKIPPYPVDVDPVDVDPVDDESETLPDSFEDDSDNAISNGLKHTFSALSVLALLFAFEI
jgi:hypothetical protein